MENESVKVKFSMFAIDAQTSDMLNEKTDKVENIVCSKGFKVIVSLQRRVMSNTKDGKRPDEDVGFIKEYNDQLFIGRKYISMFLKSALWDFGDGTTATGPVAEHCYTEQGTFTIKCTLFKPNREAVENTYKVVVVVKDPMPSMIQFVKDYTTSEVSCSKITRVARLEVFQTASPIITRDLNVIPKRVSDCMNGERRAVSETEYSDKMTNIIGERYFAFYKNEHENKTKDVQTSFKFKPTAVYEPQYQEIYARYFIQDGKPDVRLYSENLELSDKYRHLTVPTITHDGQPFQKDIIVMKDKQSFPEECVLIGKRAFIDVFYKSDTPNIGNRLQFLFDIEEHQSFKGLEHTVNYVNISPLGIDINIHNNARDKINVGWNLNGIFHEITENGNDVYVEHSFLKGLIETAYASPYIWYAPSDFGIVGEAEREFTIEPFYYVPKDFDVMNMKITTLAGNDTSFKILQSQSTEWCYKVVFYTNNTVNFSCSFNGKQGILKADKNDEGDVISQEEIITPHEIYFQENTNKVVDVLTTPFGIRDSSNLKEAFKCIFNNDNWLEKTLTKITHFFNNTVHGDTCHVSYLVSLLQSMGEELGEYSESSFQLLNDLNDFTRLLSMQRTNLIGHETSATLDTVFDGEHKGRNVNDEIYPDDIIFTDENGLIIGYQREGKPYKLEVPTEIIIYDRFTKTSRSANFFGFPSPTEWDEDDFDREFLEYKEVYKKNRDDLVFTILDYHKNWGWNLLLPDRFWTHTDAAKNTIGAYYRFFILDPNTEKRRFGNYVDISSFGTEDGGILNENWDADWKMAFHILQKILHSKNRAYADATLYEDTEDDNPYFRLTNGDYMFHNKKSPTDKWQYNMPYLQTAQHMFDNTPNIVSFQSYMPRLTQSTAMFKGCEKLTSFRCGNLSNLLYANEMFRDCYDLSSAQISNLDNLQYGEYMFAYCPELTGLHIPLPELVEGTGMFMLCSAFVEGPTSLPKLENGEYMFHYCAMREWSVDMPLLSNGKDMFNQCENLETFNVDTKNLMNGEKMFYKSNHLESLRANLHKLANGEGMFHDCVLNIASVQNISDTIGNVESGTLTLGVSQACHDDPRFISLVVSIAEKGWTVVCEVNERRS